jgi:branched-chain amino acid transport system permease protein
MNKLLAIVKKPQFGFVIVGLFLIAFRFLSGVIPAVLYDAIVKSMYYFLAGLGFTLLLGYGGLASLGTGAFVGIGAFGLHYVYRFMGQPLSIAIIAALAISIIISICFGFVSLRISGMYLAIITMGLAQIVIETIRNIPEYASGTSGGFLTNGPFRPLEIFGYRLERADSVYFLAIFVTLGMIIVYNLIHSATGRALLSVKNNEVAAQTMGINTIKYRLFAFVVSGIFGTLAGLMNMMYVRASDVNEIGLSFALNVLAAVVVGGTQSIWGVLLGTFVIFGFDLAVLQPLNLGEISNIVNGVLIIVIVMFYPGGLTQLINTIKFKIKARLNKKKEAITYE